MLRRCGLRNEQLPMDMLVQWWCKACIASLGITVVVEQGMRASCPLLSKDRCGFFVAHMALPWIWCTAALDSIYMS